MWSGSCCWNVDEDEDVDETIGMTLNVAHDMHSNLDWQQQQQQQQQMTKKKTVMMQQKQQSECWQLLLLPMVLLPVRPIEIAWCAMIEMSCAKGHSSRLRLFVLSMACKRDAMTS